MAKKVNKPFVIGLSAAVVLLGGGGFAGLKWYRSHQHDSPQQLMDDGDKLLANEEGDKAAEKYATAAYLMPDKPLPLSKLGDALYVMSKRDPQYAAEAVKQWNSALQLDPNFKPALTSMLDAYIDDMDAYQKARNFVLVRDTAARLAKIDPSDTHAVSYQYISTLSAWMNNVETPANDVQHALDGLAALAKADPTDAMLPYQISRGEIQQAENAARLGDTDTAAKKFAAAAKTMDDAAAAQPLNVMMLLRTGQIYSILSILNRNTPAEAAYDQTSGQYLDRARALVRADDKNYEEVQTVYASRKLQKGDHLEAERVYRELLMHSPNDVPVRLVLAEILQADKSTRQEAADLLAKTVTDGEKPDAARTPMARALQLRALLRLASVRMDLLEDIHDPAAYKAMLTQIDADVTKAESKTAENPETLKVRGRLELVEANDPNHVIYAVQTLTKAENLLETTGQKDYELIYTLARAHLAAQQNEEAKKLLRIIVKEFDTYTPARSLLISLLLNSNETAEAAANIDVLDKQMPNSALVTRFRILSLDPVKDKSQINELFKTLPQDKREDMLEKARIAVVINHLDDAIQLMESARGIDPKDVRVSDRLARLYLYKGDRDRAKKVLNDALAIAPKDPQLLILKARIDNATPADLFDLAKSLINEEADPLTRSLQMAQVEQLQGNGAELYKQLTAAEKANPNDPRVQDQLFTYYLATQQYDAAAKYIDPLAKANFGGSHGLLYRWKFAFAKGDYQGAVSAARDFTQQMPEFATSWITLGQSQKALGQMQDALQSFDAALERQSANRDAIRGAIDCYYALGRYTEAKRIIDDARKLYPNDMSLAEMGMEYELKYGDPANAMGPLLKQLHDDPTTVENYLNVASMYYKMSARANTTPAQSTDYLNKGIATLKDATTKFPDEMQPYINLAELQSIGNDKAAAVATLTQMTNQPKLKDSAYPKIVLAEFYMKTGQPELAEAPYRAALAVAPDSMEIRRKVAVYYSQRGNVDQAIQTIDQAPGKQSLDPTMITARLEILTAAGRFTDAEAACQAALEVKPGNANWLAIESNAQYNQQKFDAAIATAQQALAIDPKNNRALITRAMAELNRPGADLAQAIVDLTAYRDANPTDNNVRRLLADADLRRQRPDDAIRELEAALQTTPDDRAVRAMLLTCYRSYDPPRLIEGDQTVKAGDALDTLAKDPKWLMISADWSMLRKQPAAATAKMRAAVAAAPQDVTVLRTYLGTLLESNDSAGVLTATAQMLTTDPNRWWAYHARALAEKMQGDTASAGNDLNRAAALAFAQKDPDAVDTVVTAIAGAFQPDAALQVIRPHAQENPRYLLLDAKLELQKGNQEAGLKLIEAVLAETNGASPADQALIFTAAGDAYVDAKPAELDKALAAYQKLVDLQPNNVPALNQIAWIMANNLTPPRPQDALQYSTRAYNQLMKTNQQDANVFDTQGWILVLTGQPAAGAPILKQAIDMQPTAENLYHLGTAYLKLGKVSDALTQFQAAKDLTLDAIEKKQPVDDALKSAIDAGITQSTAKP